MRSSSRSAARNPECNRGLRLRHGRHHDAFEAFLEAGGPYDARAAKRYYDDSLSVGNTLDPAEACRHFRGRVPRIEVYLRAQGFPAAAGSGTSPGAD